MLAWAFVYWGEFLGQHWGVVLPPSFSRCRSQGSERRQCWAVVEESQAQTLVPYLPHLQGGPVTTEGPSHGPRKLYRPLLPRNTPTCHTCHLTHNVRGFLDPHTIQPQTGDLKREVADSRDTCSSPQFEPAPWAAGSNAVWRACERQRLPRGGARLPATQSRTTESVSFGNRENLFHWCV